MKNVLLVCLLSILGSAPLLAKGGQFKLTVTNVTKGQPITPPVVIVHAPSYEVYSLGQPASEGLATLAQDGVTDLLVAELASARGVVRTAVGSGVILPGQSQDIMVEANNSRFSISLVAMLARTNDAFLSAKFKNTRFGYSGVALAKVYDAGVEINNESCENIPAPPCGNPMVGTDGGEGFVHAHPGIQNVGDLDALRDAFGAVVAKVKITRIRQ